MANTKISGLPNASTLAGTEVMPGVQSSTTVQITLAQLVTYLTGALSVAPPITVNPQTGTTYTVVAGDKGKLITLSNTSAVAVTLPQATGSFASGWFTYVRSINNGVVTITPTTSTIDGIATLVLRRGDAAIIVSDGTNYQIILIRNVARGVTALTDSPAGTVAIDANLSNDFRLVTTSGPSSTRKLGNPTNLQDGQKITIRVKLGAASDAITFDTKWKLLGTAGTFPTTSGSIYVISGQYDATDDTITYGAQPSA